MKNILLIDGENFVHGVVKSLQYTKNIRGRQSLSMLSIPVLLSDKALQNLDIFYYMTRIKMPKEGHGLYSSANRMRLWNGRWLPSVVNQNVTLVRAGQLKVRDGKTCKSCGKTNQILLEKGVDVRIAIDVVLAKTKVFLFSSDSDLVPAVQTAVRNGSEIIYVCIEDQKNIALSRVASDTVIISNKQIEVAFKATVKSKK